MHTLSLFRTTWRVLGARRSSIWVPSVRVTVVKGGRAATLKLYRNYTDLIKLRLLFFAQGSDALSWI